MLDAGYWVLRTVGDKWQELPHCSRKPWRGAHEHDVFLWLPLHFLCMQSIHLSCDDWNLLSGVLSSLENFQCLALGVSGLCHSVYVWPAGAANAKTHKKKSQPTDHPTITEQIQLGVVSIVKLSSALSGPLVHCQCNVLSIVLFILFSSCIVFSIITLSYALSMNLVHSFLLLLRLVNCLLLL